MRFQAKHRDWWYFEPRDWWVSGRFSNPEVGSDLSPYWHLAVFFWKKARAGMAGPCARPG